MQGPKRIANFLAGVMRRQGDRFLYWSVYDPFNFGDWIGPFLYKKISGKDAWFGLPSSYGRNTVFMSAGSILYLARENCVVWGSGILTRKTSFPRPWNILAVRGPYSRERCKELGYSCPEIYGDPGILLPRFYDPIVSSNSIKSELGIIPHFRDFAYVTERFRLADDVIIIDVRHPIDQIIDQLVSCKRIVSSSLHGIIVAHAYGVPAGWVSFGTRLGGDGVKFLDHYASIGIFAPECLEDALEISIADLISYADSFPALDVTERSNKLIEVCPFPKLTSFISSDSINDSKLVISEDITKKFV